MLGGKGFYRGSSVLVSGTAGTGKTQPRRHFADAACLRGERCLYFAFEESASQIVRNMRSIGHRPAALGQEGPAAIPSPRGRPRTAWRCTWRRCTDWSRKFRPRMVVVDPISNLWATARLPTLKPMLMRLIDFLKTEQITAVFTSLTAAAASLEEQTEVGISSLIDTWLLLRDIELGGERNRCALTAIKSRGMAALQPGPRSSC